MTRTLIIGLDGADWDVIDRVMDQGRFSFLKQTIDTGATATLYAHIPQTVPAVPSLFTGRNPAKTGIYTFRADESRIVQAENLHGRTLWDILDENGTSHTILHLPLTYPPEETDDVFASGKLTPGPNSDYVYPSELQDDFIFPYDNDSYQDKIDNIGDRFDNLRTALEHAESDITFLWVDDTDSIQHHYWDDTHKVDETYLTASEQIESIWNDSDFDNLIILSDHGFGPVEPYNFHLNAWLRDNGYLKTAGSETAASLKTKLFNLGREHLPEPVKKLARRFLLAGTDDTPDAPVPGVDWDKTTAFYDRGWGLKIIEDNLDQHYDSFRDQLMDELKAITDDENETVFADVREGEDIYHGPYLDQYKDIYLMPSEKYYITRLLRDHLIDDDEISHKKRLQGNHNNNPEGIFIAYGRDFRNTDLDTVQIYDFLPTLLHLHDVPIPRDLDGTVLLDAFASDSDAATRDIRYQTPDISEGIDV